MKCPNKCGNKYTLSELKAINVYYPSELCPVCRKKYLQCLKGE